MKKNVSGTVSLCDFDDNISQLKRYKDKKTRTDIIERWKSIYSLEKRGYIIKILPDEKPEKLKYK
jgi:hypothetical protein